jgi:hypothetical protein
MTDREIDRLKLKEVFKNGDGKKISQALNEYVHKWVIDCKPVLDNVSSEDYTDVVKIFNGKLP